MKLYELTYLISPNLTEAEIKNFQEKIISFIQEKGTLIEAPFPKKRILAYLIKKNNSAFSGTLNFQMKPENLADFEKKLNLESCLIRYLILGKIKSKPAKVPRKLFIFREKVKAPKREKVKLEEIDQKLKEILDET